jgi:methyl-accepting chemotaxis protein
LVPSVSARAETAKQLASLDAGMMKAFRSLEPQMVEVGQTVERLYRESDAAEAATRDSVKMWMLMAFVLGIALVSILSLLIGRSISKALSMMVGAMTRLAPRRDRRDGRCGRCGGLSRRHKRASFFKSTEADTLP